MSKKIINIRVSLKGRPIRAYRFNKNVITVGRDPQADIYLDNAGVSREHVRIEQTPGGYYAVEDLGSANGTFVNEQSVKREYLTSNDVVRVGKFSLWVSYDEDRRGDEMPRPMSANAYEGTTVLSVSELDEMMAKVQASESEGPPLGVVEGTARGAGWTQHAEAPRPVAWLPVALIAFTAGVVLGSGVMWFLSH
jgi:predicted component of type VI protein secretion system